VLIGSIVPLAWLGMMAVHELGHVVGAWWTGGVVARVVLHPLAISRTDLEHNPRPRFVAWSGPVVGVLIPLVAWALAALCRLPGSYLARFFAGFCLIANGSYIGLGSFEHVGDAGDLLRHGVPIAQLWAFGAVTVPLGLLLWHRLGPSFGLGSSKGQVSAIAAYASLALLVALVAVELAVFPS
jgi:hypothetical protein